MYMQYQSSINLLIVGVIYSLYYFTLYGELFILGEFIPLK